MRARAGKTGAVLALSAIMTAGLGVAASPASAAAFPAPGATFYTGWFTTEVGYFPTATGVCTPLPQGADSLIATTPVTNVSIYRAADCSGSETAVGTLRNWEPNVFKSFIAR
ncbi:hypothetical protein [Micromonospora vulcania]|uniref:Peptidase inhibitor family I36 n=1 Tax=Micromonospora vulcania TaxID=1441873 RepID=A0ABW1H809_9ACTN